MIVTYGHIVQTISPVRVIGIALLPGSTMAEEGGSGHYLPGLDGVVHRCRSSQESRF